MNTTKRSEMRNIKKNNREILYKLLYFVTAIYPIWFLWRPKTNDHVNQWFASALAGLYIVDTALYYLIHSKRRAYLFYAARDIVLSFTLATCLTLGVLQIVISHPRPNFKDNKNGILESEQDANILSGWLILFMTLIVRDQLKLHRDNVFKTDAKIDSKLFTLDWLNIMSAAFVIIYTIVLIVTHCQNFANGCHDPNLKATKI